MSAIDPLTPAPAEPLPEPRARLRAAAHQLEGIFLAQLFQAMRETVPQDSTGSGTGQAMFTAMLDDELAVRAADQLHRGIGEALYRQLSRRLPEER